MIGDVSTCVELDLEVISGSGFRNFFGALFKFVSFVLRSTVVDFKPIDPEPFDCYCGVLLKYSTSGHSVI